MVSSRLLSSGSIASKHLRRHPPGGSGEACTLAEGVSKHEKTAGSWDFLR
jgi:hypothetical protein